MKKEIKDAEVINFLENIDYILNVKNGCVIYLNSENETKKYIEILKNNQGLDTINFIYNYGEDDLGFDMLEKKYEKSCKFYD